jgi:hypothetical protein
MSGNIANYKIKGAHAGLSGHVSYTTQQHNFWGMVDRRNNKIDVMRKTGTLPARQTRNPLRAEKTPRRDDLAHFDSSIPTGRKELKAFERWDYPEVDFGLMGKFRSQQDRYEAFHGTQKEYIEKLKAKHDMEKAMVEEARRKEAEEIAAQANMPSARDYPSARSTARDSARGTGRKDELELDLHSEKIADFKLLGQVEPQVLERYRAERAQKYLLTYHEKESNPLDPPRMRKTKHPRAFLPNGVAHTLEDTGAPPPLEDGYKRVGDHHKKVYGKFKGSPRKGEKSMIRSPDKAKTAALNHLLGALDTAEKDIARTEARLESLRTRR